MIRSLRFAALIASVTATLSGCGALTALGQASRPLEVYELSTPTIAAGGPRRNIELVVEEPIASGTLDVERIMIRPAPLQAQYLPDIRWADTAPVMVQTLLVRSLAQTNRLSSVGRRPIGTVADFAVLSELTAFQAETLDATGTATVNVQLAMRLVRERDSRVVAARTFATSEPALSNNADDIVAAFDRATSRMITESVSWVLENAR
ncbi:ABC-type transport auxiliary lipoprotein family protein [Marivita hallyeonensis]|uniref:Cholesterol transport system auxiliary component n=1 Tax=Marivita hallyeonensis TaxID=996342 RepID=A0A1M5MMJ1_9RHOB|nr:ABC-type transport auxiliary lipoprotein family protein [Marivita hallyeonensis]SHG78600.1 cholesterol transport system auxiliary component [Marivita hallyeonensis]